jgi:hypothetical protein
VIRRVSGHAQTPPLAGYGLKEIAHAPQQFDAGLAFGVRGGSGDRTARIRPGSP